ncbi:MAG: ADP-ribosylglycohydrolase family protein [Anaerolineales bacterium]
MADRDRAILSLTGLSVGDGFGEQFFTRSWGEIEARKLPKGSWKWTDDTHMAFSIVEELLDQGEIEQDSLARRFSDRYSEEPWRGYGAGAMKLLSSYSDGAEWRMESLTLFDGGSYGNGAAMRAAPIGGYFWGDPERASVEAEKSAAVTHAHPEGKAGAMAVAAAASLAPMKQALRGKEYLEPLLAFVPDGLTKAGMEEAMRIGPEEHARAASVLGTGAQIAAFDTVPFCLWVVAHHGFDFEQALWTTVAGLGDRDTTCAIVGGIVALTAEIPENWLDRCEPLPGFRPPEAP